MTRKQLAVGVAVNAAIVGAMASAGAPMAAAGFGILAYSGAKRANLKRKQADNNRQET